MATDKELWESGQRKNLEINYITIILSLTNSNFCIFLKMLQRKPKIECQQSEKCNIMECKTGRTLLKIVIPSLYNRCRRFSHRIRPRVSIFSAIIRKMMKYFIRFFHGLNSWQVKISSDIKQSSFFYFLKIQTLVKKVLHNEYPLKF